MSKPTKDMYLKRAQMCYLQIEHHERRSMSLSGNPLSRESTTYRFLGRSMWFNMMAWAGFPMRLEKVEL